MSEHAAEAGEHFNLFSLSLASAGALGSFSGALIFGVTNPIRQTDPFVCQPEFIFQDAMKDGASTYIESFVGTDLCAVENVCLLEFPQLYLIQGCIMQYTDIWFAVMAALLFLVYILFSFVYLPRHSTNRTGESLEATVFCFFFSLVAFFVCTLKRLYFVAFTNTTNNFTRLDPCL